MIIFAHIGSYGVLFQIRNFDVPLMVLVSGMSFGLSYKTNEEYFNYLWKRVKRLIFPVWIFLTVYFVSLLMLDPQSLDLDLKTVITSYLLIGGIGYVWIIKVFILVAMISPFIFQLHTKISSHKKYFLLLALIFAIYEVIRYLSLPYIQSETGKAISYISHYIVPYGIVFAVGLRIPLLKNVQIKYLSILSFILFVITAVGLYLFYGHFVPTQNYKYPPSFYYFAYALFVSCTLWLYSEEIETFFIKIKIEKIVTFIAQNSIWIYLWHIPIVKYFNAHFLIKYIIVISLATILAYIQVYLVKKIIKRLSSDSLKKNIKILLTG
jgi:fucose 4-O-acetylase-like acetyltransferase